MIKEIKVYTIICDNCGQDVLNEDESCGYNEIDYVEDCCREANWEQIEDKWYCPDCYETDDDDNITIYRKRKIC